MASAAIVFVLYSLLLSLLMNSRLIKQDVLSIENNDRGCESFALLLVCKNELVVRVK